MRQTNTGLSLSATDLSNSLACRQLTGLDMSVTLEGRKRPFRNDPLGDILRDRGLAHEKAYVDHLKDQGRNVLDLSSLKDPEAAAAATLDAMRAGEGAIVQAALLSDDGRWYGRPDVLLRTDTPVFLYSLNRLNVATSRARCAAILVMSPRLFEPECKTPRQMKLANALCRLREMAGG